MNLAKLVWRGSGQRRKVGAAAVKILRRFPPKDR